MTDPRKKRFTLLPLAVLLSVVCWGCGQVAPPCDPVCSAGSTCDVAARRCVLDVCPDDDGDGHTSIECGGDDCDDANAARYPGATELCNTVDEDCNPSTYGTLDDDGDGYVSAACCDGTVCGQDCDDSNAVVNPRAPDICGDGLDNDCNGLIDDGDRANTYADLDGDGHGAGAAVFQCASIAGYSLLGNDCDDTLAGVQPGAIRCTAKFGEYELCQSDGGFVLGNCLAQAACRPQPGGDGVCL